MSQVTGKFLTEDIAIYIMFSAGITYEFLLFSLALWAGIRCSRGSPLAARNGAQRLRVILIEGNVIYFLV